ncbi:hypothetical protein [Rhodoplanes serenus]|uniref:hypothetical protein n=1 Tax=Rhodoplanes serenus TaxID=200615 RepID=UPI000DABE9A5|nr:hypothetical protein [Rhodoplanes serenus]RAI35891.1 hypothetical protein CH340_04670 [Rhodoplanes serenus]
MNQPKPTKPSHDVFVVEGEGERAYWTRIGAAWSHDDGHGYNVTLTCVPVNGRLVIRTAKAKEREAGR